MNKNDYFDCPTNGRITLNACDGQKLRMGRTHKHPCRNCSLKEHEAKTVIPAEKVLRDAQATVEAVPARERHLGRMERQLRYLGGLRRG